MSDSRIPHCANTLTDEHIDELKNDINDKLGVSFTPEFVSGFQRFPAPDKGPNNDACWFKWLTDDFRVASYGSHITGKTHSWQATGGEFHEENIGDRIVPPPYNPTDENMKVYKRTNRAIQEKLFEPRDEHTQYTQRKGIDPRDVLFDGTDLTAIMIDAQGRYWNYQSITDIGEKRFQKGGRVQGVFSLFGDLKDGDVIYITEGYATAYTIHQLTGKPVAAAMSAGNLLAVGWDIKQVYPNAKLIFAADNDHSTQGNPGLEKAQSASDTLDASVAIPPLPCNKREGCTCTDFNDAHLCKGGDTVVKTLLTEAESAARQRSTPKPTLELEPYSVLPLQKEMLPTLLFDFIDDVSLRVNCPPDFVAVALLAGLAGVIGRKYGVHPKQNDDWLVTPTLWAAMIGPPSSKKSPALGKVKTLIDRIEKDLLRKAIDANDSLHRRIVVNDSTTSRLIDILANNPSGLLLIRDELAGLLVEMERKDRQADRAFMLECFSGNGAFTKDRVTTGHTRVEHCSLSIVGGIQPSRLQSIVDDTVSGKHDDGLLQRFQLAVWPASPPSQYTDETPNTTAENAVSSILAHFAEMPFSEDDEPTAIRFHPDAQPVFREWMELIDGHSQSEDCSPVIASFIQKMPRTIVSLALIFELIVHKQPDTISKASLVMALKWYDYLLSHQRRVLQMNENQVIENANLIYTRRDRLNNPFTARDIRGNKWRGLTKTEDIQAAIDLLIARAYLYKVSGDGERKPGRPSQRYRWRHN